MSKGALESYASSLMEADGKLIEFSDITSENSEETAKLRAEQAALMKTYAKVSVAQYKLAKGLNQIQSVYEDYKEVLEEADEDSLDFHEAVGALSEALTDAFGMEVDGSFIKENLEKIKEVVNGSEEALVELRAELNKDFIMSLDLETDNAENELITELNNLSETALQAGIGVELKLENDTAIEGLNEALATGKATIENIESMFNNANLAMPKYKIAKLPGEVTETTSEVSGKIMGIPFSYTTTAKTTSMRDVPYFGDNPPTVAKNDDGDYVYTDFGGGGDLSTASLGPLDDLDNIVNYEGDGGKKSSGKEYKPEIDRYHEINEQIQDQKQLLDELAKSKDRAFGNKKLKLLDQEIKAYEILKQKQEDLLLEQKNYLSCSK